MPATVESFVETSGRPAVRGMIHLPATPSGDGLVLTHGAGGNCDGPLLIALAEALSDKCVTVLRCNLPFRQQRPSGPPRGSGGDDRAGLRRAVQLLRESGLKRVFLGGQSYGGRQATMLAAEEPDVTEGLLILSYPLHPPGQPAQLRTKHLPQIKPPCLFASGSKDPFGSPQELETAIQTIPARTSFLLIEGAGHNLGYGRRPSKKMQDVPARIAQVFLANWPSQR